MLDLLSSTAPEEAEVSLGQHQVSHVPSIPQNISLNRSPSLPRYASVPAGEISGCRHPLRCKYLQEEGFSVPPQRQGGYFGCRYLHVGSCRRFCSGQLSKTWKCLVHLLKAGRLVQGQGWKPDLLGAGPLRALKKQPGWGLLVPAGGCGVVASISGGWAPWPICWGREEQGHRAVQSPPADGTRTLLPCPFPTPRGWRLLLRVSGISSA